MLGGDKAAKPGQAALAVSLDAFALALWRVEKGLDEAARAG
jgi:hypothetical protein